MRKGETRQFRDLKPTQYKRFIICDGCGKRVEVHHRLRKYCDKCRANQK